MSALKKEDVLSEMDELIKSMTKEEKHTYAQRLLKIKEGVEKLLKEEEDELYYGIVNESMKEVWDNEKDDVYNDL
ncbi:hypothetical protein [Mesobacillus maritimus]|uniref:hypothetical protein n=1 Tax=Mesobacillus maritimus TaxID=1643336 RepID=UPI0038517B7E